MHIKKKTVEELLNSDVSGMAGTSFYCSICGEEHSVDIEKIIIERGGINKIVSVSEPFKKEKVFLVADNNTYPVCGEDVERLLKKENFNLKTFIFNTTKQLVPNNQNLGRLLIEIEKGTGLIIAVGSGVIGDLCRHLSYKLDIPYITVGTAPSMDGYASVVAPIIVDGNKVTLEGVYPRAIIGDLDVLQKAPMETVYAGYGDVIGKLIALTDWDMARKLNGEKYCYNCVAFVNKALETCIDNTENIKNREEKAIKYLMDALILTGITIGMFGDSRPASGAEHHYAHYWDEDAISRGEDHPLHGNSVGVGTVVAAELYQLIKDRLPVKVNPPSPDKIRSLLRQLGALDNPKDLGISKDLFRRSIIHSKDNRPKFTISHLAGQMGLLEEFSDILTKKFYD